MLYLALGVVLLVYTGLSIWRERVVWKRICALEEKLASLGVAVQPLLLKHADEVLDGLSSGLRRLAKNLAEIEDPEAKAMMAPHAEKLRKSAEGFGELKG